MRKILLATTALVAFAGAAQAAESPIQVTVGGYVDFRAAMFHESENPATLGPAVSTANTNTLSRRSGDFQTEYGLTIAADGKAAGGIEYGSFISLNNVRNPGVDTTAADADVKLDEAYVYMSGPWGKVLMGDETGATDLFVMAPTVGEGQIDGKYTNFTDPATLAAFRPAYVDTTETNTKVTYYTPKVGNANHKVQVGVTYTPNTETGISVRKYDGNVYHNQIEAAAQYTGTFSPVNVVVSPMFATGAGQGNDLGQPIRDYAAWGLGAQAMYAGFTLGGSYVDAGNMGTITGQDKDQNVWTLGLKYGFDKVTLAANYMDGEGYFNSTFRNSAANSYVNDFNAWGLGATYTWFPGLTTAADAVFFDQSRDGVVGNDQGHVLMLSQKMAF